MNGSSSARVKDQSFRHGALFEERGEKQNHISVCKREGGKGKEEEKVEGAECLLVLVPLLWSISHPPFPFHFVIALMKHLKFLPFKENVKEREEAVPAMNFERATALVTVSEEDKWLQGRITDEKVVRAPTSFPTPSFLLLSACLVGFTTSFVTFPTATPPHPFFISLETRGRMQ